MGRLKKVLGYFKEKFHKKNKLTVQQKNGLKVSTDGCHVIRKEKSFRDKNRVENTVPVSLKNGLSYMKLLEDEDRTC